MTRRILLTLLLPALGLVLSTQGHAAPLCLPEATAAVLSHLGTPTDFRVLARELPVHADGVDLFDLRLWLADHGWHARVVAPEPPELLALVAAGWPLVVVRAEPRHAVALLPNAQGKGLPAGKVQVTVVDGATSLPQAAVRALTGLHVAMVIAKGPLPAADARLDAEFMATGWLRRAREHRLANEAQLTLVIRAVTAAPCFQPARQMLAEVVGLLSPTPKLGQMLAAVPRCQR